MLLEVREDNDRARAVYAAAGYREIDRRRGYYRIRGRRIDALVMERDLTARRAARSPDPPRSARCRVQGRSHRAVRPGPLTGGRGPSGRSG